MHARIRKSLPVHPRTGLTALGLRKDGRPIWPVKGASEPAPEPTPTDPAEVDDDGLPEQPSDDAPESEWKKYARKWEGIAKAKEKPDPKSDPAYREALEKAKKLDELEAANATELEKATKAAEENEAKAKAANDRAVRAEVRALADAFADRDDAVLNLGDLSKYVTDDDIDVKTIKADLAKVIERKPHLAKPEPKVDPKTGKPVEQLRPGGNPDAPERATTLGAAIAAHYAQP